MVHNIESCANCKFFFIDVSFGPECSALSRHVQPNGICNEYAPIQQSKDCSTCEFYCSTPPNDGRCNVTGNYTAQTNRCNQYTPYISRQRSFVPPTTKYPPMPTSRNADTNTQICLSCGLPLSTETRGRRKYCAKCGCYLPEIIYDEQFRDLTKMLKPMSIPHPKPIPTVYTH